MSTASAVAQASFGRKLDVSALGADGMTVAQRVSLLQPSSLRLVAGLALLLALLRCRTGLGFIT